MKTLKMSVENMGFFLDRFAQDCGPLQYVRELTQNSIEAIRRAGRERGHVVWSYDERIYKNSGIKKLSITDNGCGMSDDEMVRYLNNLSSSSSQQSVTGNYGIGAKISAYAKNQAGINYFSWQNREGYMVYSWKDPATGEYGLRPFEFEDMAEHVSRLTAQAIDGHPIIAEVGSGTHVVLHGMTENEDTFSSNKEIPGRSAGQWVRRYLNTRYFRIPDNIEITCRTGGGGDEQHRYVTGQCPMLDAICLSSGKVSLSDATALWWILPKFVKGAELAKPIRLGNSPKDITKIDTLGPGYDVVGHLAAIFQNELHDTLRGNPARLMLQQFGVTFGYDQVVVYIEPHGGNVIPNVARTSLNIEAEPIRWGDWADDFRAKLPKQIREFIEHLQPAAFDNRAEDDRIRTVMDLYKVPKFKLDPDGSKLIVDPDSGVRSLPTGSVRNGPGAGNGRGGRITQNVYNELISTEGNRGSEVQAKQDIPTVQLVSAQPTEKLIECFGESIAAQTQDRPEDLYPTQAGWFVLPNTINLNLDFGGVRSLIDLFSSEYGDASVARAAVSAIVLSWWSQTLKEAIQGTRALAQSGVWTRAQVVRAIDGDAGAALLTASVMPRYLVYQAIGRGVHGRLGPPQKEAGQSRSAQAAGEAGK